MAILYTSQNGYIAVGKAQAIHHGLLYYPPNFDDTEKVSKSEWIADYNRTLRIQIVRRNEDGKVEYVDVPVDFRNYALTVADIHHYNRPIGNQRKARLNKHRFLSKKQVDRNGSFCQYSLDSQRVTWNRAEDIYSNRKNPLFVVMNPNKTALKRALLVCQENYLLGMTLPKLLEERKKSIAERNRLKAKGLAAYRRENVNDGGEQMLLSNDDWYRFRNLTSVIRTLNERIGYDYRAAA